MAQDRGQWRALVNTAMNLRVPSNVGKILSSCTTGGFSSRAQLHGVSELEVKTGEPYAQNVDGPNKNQYAME
jgi:hypothetical protein